jgi:hypothetical protein
MRKFLKILPLLTLIVLLGCSRGQTGTPLAPGPQGTPTPVAAPPTRALPSPAASLIPANQITATLLPILSETPSATPVPPTLDPTYLNFPSVTPSATLDPGLILLRIVSPGPMSKVISPVEFIVHVAPEYTGTTRIELIGEDGTELYRKVFKTFSNIGYYTRVAEKVDFEIKGAAEIGRLQISTLDNKGRLQAFNSVRVLLQAVGENEFTPPLALQERVLLRYPKTRSEISGGNLPVTGEFLPANDMPIVLELIDADGHVMGSRILQLGPADGKYQQFTTSLPYQISEKTQARLVIRQSDDRIEGYAYLYSLKLTIGP